MYSYHAAIPVSRRVHRKNLWVMRKTMAPVASTLKNAVVEITNLNSFSSLEYPVSVMSIAALEDGCLQEMNRYWRGEKVSGQYGLELFHRAMARRDAQAWEGLQRCFAGL